jgi:glucose-fructose oxidoreductase
VLCEKPLAPSLADAEAKLAACRRGGVRLSYGASYRFLPALVKARELIQAGAIGDPVLVREYEVGGSGPDSRAVFPSGHYPLGGPGGTPMGLVDHGVHLIDAFTWLMGSPIRRVMGRGNVSGEVLAPEYLVAEFENGAIGHLLYDEGTYPTGLPAEGCFSWGASWDAQGFHPGGTWTASPGSIHVHGTRGALRIFHYADALFLIDGNGPRQIALEGKPAPGHFAAQMDAFAASLLGLGGDWTPGKAGIDALRTIEAIYRSAEQRRWVEVEPA